MKFKKNPDKIIKKTNPKQMDVFAVYYFLHDHIYSYFEFSENVLSLLTWKIICC